MIWAMTNDFPKLGWKVRLWRFQRLSNKRRHGSVGDSESDKSIFFLSKSILPQVIPPLLCHLAFRLSISSLEEKILQFPVKTFSTEGGYMPMLSVRYYHFFTAFTLST